MAVADCYLGSWAKAIIYFNGGGAVGGACGAKFAHVCGVSARGFGLLLGKNGYMDLPLAQS